MATSVYDLAAEVVLYLVDFQRRVENNEGVRYDETRSEVLTLLGELDRRSHIEPGLWDHWTKARIPLVYLIDEVMIVNCPWPHQQDWANDCLEVALLGHPQALGGQEFYTECDEAVRQLELSERHERHDKNAKVEILMVFYVALQTGFKGKYGIDQDAWREYKGHLFSKLPAYAQTRTKQLFPEAEQHTTRIDPNYEPVMRLMYVAIGLALCVALYFGATRGYWQSMVGTLKDAAQRSQNSTAAQASPS